jgi:hypothetical protein
MATSALIVIDMLNPYEHEDADELAANVEGMVAPLRELIERTHESDVEPVYVNDNYGDFAASRDYLGSFTGPPAIGALAGASGLSTALGMLVTVSAALVLLAPGALAGGRHEGETT